MVVVEVPPVGMGWESGGRQTAKRRSLLRWTLGQMEEKAEVAGCAHHGCFGEWAAEGCATGMLPRELSWLRSAAVEQTRRMLPQLPLKQQMGELLPRRQHQPQQLVWMARPY